MDVQTNRVIHSASDIAGDIATDDVTISTSYKANDIANKVQLIIM